MPKSCFFVGPIGSDGTEIRRHSDQVLKYIVRKALEPEYEVQRSDEINRSGMIIAQIVERVFEADLVVADLTGPNANVFYEVAIRHATKRPAVHLVKADEKPPFDLNQIRVIPFDLRDPDSIEEAQRRLKQQVKAIEGGEEVLTPVQFAQILHSLETGTPKDKQLLEVLQGLSQGIRYMSSQLNSLQSQVNLLEAFQDSQESPQRMYPNLNILRNLLTNPNAGVQNPIPTYTTENDEIPTLAAPDPLLDDKKKG